MALTLNQIETALLDTIGADSDLKLKSAGGYSRTIETYEGQLEQTLEEVLHLFPCVFAAIVECTFQTETSRQLIGKPLSITVLLGDQNLRSNKAARRGEAGSVGVYKMVDDLLDLLTNHRLGLDETLFDPLFPVRMGALLHRKDAAVYAVEFEGSYVRDF